MARTTLTITLYKSELIYDIQNKTYLTGRSRQTGNNHEEVANMQANDDDENINQVMRSIQSAYDSLRPKLGEYISSTDSTSSNKLLDSDTSTADKNKITVSLSMPENYNKGDVDTITSAMHQYIVNSAVSAWFTITNKADASDYVALAAANLETLREALNKRVRPTRTTTNLT